MMKASVRDQGVCPWADLTPVSLETEPPALTSYSFWRSQTVNLRKFLLDSFFTPCRMIIPPGFACNGLEPEQDGAVNASCNITELQTSPPSTAAIRSPAPCFTVDSVIETGVSLNAIFMAHQARTRRIELENGMESKKHCFWKIACFWSWQLLCGRPPTRWDKAGDHPEATETTNSSERAGCRAARMESSEDATFSGSFVPYARVECYLVRMPRYRYYTRAAWYVRPSQINYYGSLVIIT